jgi:hypothetical protein
MFTDQLLTSNKLIPLRCCFCSLLFVLGAVSRLGVVILLGLGRFVRDSGVASDAGSFVWGPAWVVPYSRHTDLAVRD